MAIRIHVGRVEVAGLIDRRHPIDPEWHYPGTPLDAWEPWRAVYPAESDWLLNFRAFLIRAEGRTVLLDTGWGPDFAPPGAPATPARLLDELASLGVGVDDVDEVLFSHLHADHVGWNLVRDGDEVRPRFRNARYRVPAADWAHYSGREEMHPNIRQNAMPLGRLGVLDLYDGEIEILPSMRSLPTPGHTPGHMSFTVSDGGRTLFLLGDLVHHPIIAEHVDWAHRFDNDPAAAIAMRRMILERLERDGTLTAAGHFPAPGIGWFRRTGGRRTWQAVAVEDGGEVEA